MGNLLMELLYRAFIYAKKYRMEIIGLFFAVSFFMGVIIYSVVYGLTFWDTLSYSLGLFAMDVKTPSEITDLAIPIDKINPYWHSIFIASTLAKFTVGLGVFLLFFRSVLSHWYASRVIINGDHNIVVGLGRNSRFFINSMSEKREHRHKIIVFETDKEHEYLDKYKNKRVSIVLEDVEMKLDDLNLEACKNVFISTGSDEKNIYYALKFLERFKGTDSTTKLVVHIEDRTLRNFYSDTGVFHDSNVELKVFSFNKESARILFQKHAIDEKSSDEKSKEIKIHVIGEDDLSISVIVEACKVAHFSDEKRLTINCIGRDTTAIKEKIDYAFPEIDKIKNIDIVYLNIDPDKKEFYDGENELWREIDNLKHLFYCYDDILKNIKIATKVKDVTFLRRAEEGRKINFHIATMNHQKIAKEIEATSKENVFVFAQAEEVCSYDNLINNEIDELAKLINYDYFKASDGDGYTKEQIAKIKNADDLWSNTLINDKKSSMGQAIHIKTKLNYLGLKVTKNRTLNREKLLSENRKKIYKALEIKDVSNFELSDKMRKKLDKLAVSEHNRWIALLQMMDYQLSKDGTKDKMQKYHPLIKPLSEFSKEEMEKYAPYDVNAVLKIAEYEAHVGNEIKHIN